MQFKLNTLAFNVYLKHFNHDLFLQTHVGIYITYVPVSEIWNVNQSTFFDPDIYKGAKVGDVIHDPGK